MDILAGYWLCIQTLFGQKCLVSQGMRSWYHRVDWYVLVPIICNDLHFKRPNDQ